MLREKEKILYKSAVPFIPNKYTTLLVLSIHHRLLIGKKRSANEDERRRAGRPCRVFDLVKVEPRTKSTSISPVFRRAFFAVWRFSSTLRGNRTSKKKV
jgi:hypothetical protein